MQDDASWMQRALTLAAQGQGAVEPNPMVGAVLLDASGKLLSEGWHRRYGGPHAEVDALTGVGDAARGGTLYVTLEPCSHYGKTPPCTDAVLRSGVKRVVVAMPDPFPQVNGRGLAILRDAGIDVTVSIEQSAAERLNAPYLKRVRTGQPWVIAKWAMTLDGKIATATGDSRWISGPGSRARVHELRGRVDGILVGRGTLVADDPLLTARPAGPRVASRIILTGSGQLPDKAKLRETITEAAVIIVAPKDAGGAISGWVADGAEHLPLAEGAEAIPSLLKELGRRGMTNLLVEGGAGVLGSFFAAGAVDEAWVYVAPKVVGGAGPGPVAGPGVERIADAWQAASLSMERIEDDVWIRARFR